MTRNSSKLIPRLSVLSFNMFFIFSHVESYSCTMHFVTVLWLRILYHGSSSIMRLWNPSLDTKPVGPKSLHIILAILAVMAFFKLLASGLLKLSVPNSKQSDKVVHLLWLCRPVVPLLPHLGGKLMLSRESTDFIFIAELDDWLYKVN